jgi:hypothetical protein
MRGQKKKGVMPRHPNEMGEEFQMKRKACPKCKISIPLRVAKGILQKGYYSLYQKFLTNQLDIYHVSY